MLEWQTSSENYNPDISILTCTSCILQNTSFTCYWTKHRILCKTVGRCVKVLQQTIFGTNFISIQHTATAELGFSSSHRDTQCCKKQILQQYKSNSAEPNCGISKTNCEQQIIKTKLAIKSTQASINTANMDMNLAML